MGADLDVSEEKPTYGGRVAEIRSQGAEGHTLCPSEGAMQAPQMEGGGQEKHAKQKCAEDARRIASRGKEKPRTEGEVARITKDWIIIVQSSR